MVGGSEVCMLGGVGDGGWIRGVYAGRGGSCWAERVMMGGGVEGGWGG